MEQSNHQRHTIFIAVQLGIENLAYYELTNKFEEIEKKNIHIHQGGIEINECHLTDVINMQHHLKCATRILLRITNFKVRDLPKLYNKTKKVNWNAYFMANLPNVNIKAIGSRLFDSRKIEKTILDAIKSYQEANAIKKALIEKYQKFTHELYVRIENDLLTFSLDLTGKRMDIRGDKVLSVKAPLRSTIAASMVTLIKHNKLEFKSLVDPMSGSGTLTKEFLEYYRPMKRSFSYLSSPLFTDIDIKIKNYEDHTDSVNTLVSDIEKENVQIINENLGINTAQAKDFFDIKEIPKDSLVVLNPPYNERLKYKNKDTINFIKKLKEHLLKLSPNYICVIHPEKIKIEGYKSKLIGPVNNGGIKTTISLLIRA